ncbi:hypothetical protein EXIGLDRAFT_673437 [Exidia glandulosa HHB12029]|uniref:Uncharacterized protein n=1 Tax=Exidia glandulosa HHB12029 TaxID=1314781 RepID=A0A165IYZ6_EXIGL|nr:hypothetical protein EXIGLDRAFT_673437 [Exidia glandulosa HHB12029]
MAQPPKLELRGVGRPDDSFDGLWHTVQGLNEAQGAEKRFNAISDRLRDANDKMEENAFVAGAKSLNAKNPDLATGAMNAVNDIPALGEKVKAVKQALSKFAEHSQFIMKTLDAVQQVHPFIGIVVLAFKAAIQLELTRRENDQKVLLLKSQMIDMMEVLLDLRNIKDTKKVGPDGETIEGRMQRILEAAEKDIRDCSATCEKYIHKKFIVKLFDGSRWEARLSAFAEVFAARKAEFAFALNIHMAQGVDNLQNTMIDVTTHVHSTSDSTSMLLLFRQLDSPKERELMQFIKDKGGPKVCSENDKIFRELQDKMKGIRDPASSGGGKSFREPSAAGEAMSMVQNELRSDLGLALANDRKNFDRKFSAVQTKLEEMKHVIRHNSDRVISAINAGPHDRILDQDLHTIWKDMAWRGSVKARHFIVAVQDYFIQQYTHEEQEYEGAMEALESLSRPISPTHSHISDATDYIPPQSAVVTRAWQARIAHGDLQDRWAIKYITLTRVQAVLEAFDDDASGWISVKEANIFTSSRPQDYSVIRWLAFWAAGFRVLCVRHAERINNFRAQMTALAVQVLPRNRARVNKYIWNGALAYLDLLIRDVLSGWEDNKEDPNLMSYFEDYAVAEEKRLETNLESFEWNIDASNTLQMITGSGRIERHVFGLVDLVLKRHVEIIRLACKMPLDDRELWDAERTIDNIIESVLARVTVLASNVRSQNENPSIHLQVAYNGMFSSVYQTMTGELIDTYEYDPSYTTSDQKEPREEILKYRDDDGAPHRFYASLDDADDVPAGVLEGHWTGRYDLGMTAPDVHDGLVSTHFKLEEDNAVSGRGKDSNGNFVITGSLSAMDSSPTRIVFKKEYTLGKLDDGAVAWRYDGELDDQGTMSGRYGRWTEDPSTFVPIGEFSMSRATLDAARHRPSPEAFENNRARAWWTLALNAVQERVQRKMWSWSFFRQRRGERIAVVDAYKHILAEREPWRYQRNWPDDGTQYLQVVQDLEQRLVPEDTSFYRWLGERELQTEIVHGAVCCDSCQTYVIDVRHKCLECQVVSPFDGVDLCINCVDRHVYVERHNLEHHPSHYILKTIRVIMPRDVVRVLRQARDSIGTAKQVFASADTYRAMAGYASNDDDLEEVLIPRCTWCKELVSKPCWYCAECDEPTFVCVPCELQQLAMSKGNLLTDSFAASESGWDEEVDEAEGDAAGPEGDGESDEDSSYAPSATTSGSGSSWSSIGGDHHWSHVLVRMQDVPPEPPRVELESRMTMLEQRLATHETAMHRKLDGLESSVKELQEKVDSVHAVAQRLSTLEDLLNRLLARSSAA